MCAWKYLNATVHAVFCILGAMQPVLRTAVALLYRLLELVAELLHTCEGWKRDGISVLSARVS